MDITRIAEMMENGGFQLGKNDDAIKPGKDKINYDVVPYIADPKAWEQYSDGALYDAEVRLREWLQEMSAIPTFKRKRSARTYKFSQVFEILFGRPYVQKTDGRYSTKLSKLFRYYCSSTAKNYYDRETGKTQSKTSFCFSPARLKNPPYSLKLRLEWLAEQGILPNAMNMKIPKDLGIGHARNPMTEEHREQMREAGRQRYNEYQRKLRAEHNAGRAVRSYNRRASDSDGSVQDNG